MTKIERRLAEGLYWPTADRPKQTLWQHYKRWAILLVPILLLACYLLGRAPAALVQEMNSQQRAAARALAAQQAETQHFIITLANIFNGRGVLDKASGTAYFFERPLAVKMGEDQ
jgi:hypothetical protein